MPAARPFWVHAPPGNPEASREGSCRRWLTAVGAKRAERSRTRPLHEGSGHSSSMCKEHTQAKPPSLASLSLSLSGILGPERDTCPGLPLPRRQLSLGFRASTTRHQRASQDGVYPPAAMIPAGASGEKSLPVSLGSCGQGPLTVVAPAANRARCCLYTVIYASTRFP